MDIGEVVQSQQKAMAGVRDAVQTGLGRVGNKRPECKPNSVPPRKKSRFAHVDDSEEEDMSSDDENVREHLQTDVSEGALPLHKDESTSKSIAV